MYCVKLYYSDGREAIAFTGNWLECTQVMIEMAILFASGLPTNYTQWELCRK